MTGSSSTMSSRELAVGQASTKARRRHGTPGRTSRSSGGRRGAEALLRAELFGWEIDSDNPMGRGTVQREGNVNDRGVGIGGGIAGGPTGPATTLHVEVPDVEAALATAEARRTRVMGPDEVPGPASRRPLPPTPRALVGVMRFLT